MKLQQSQSEASALKYQVINHHTQSHTLQYMQVSLYAHTHTCTSIHIYSFYFQVGELEEQLKEEREKNTKLEATIKEKDSEVKINNNNIV